MTKAFFTKKQKQHMRERRKKKKLSQANKNNNDDSLVPKLDKASGDNMDAQVPSDTQDTNTVDNVSKKRSRSRSQQPYHV